MLRFVVLTLALTVLLLGLGSLAADAVDGGGFGPRLDGRFVLGGWALQAAGLVALFLLVQGRGGGWWMDGLLTAWLAWIFRGPVVALALAESPARGAGHGAAMALQWLLIYTLCGLAIALVARRMRIRR